MSTTLVASEPFSVPCSTDPVEAFLNRNKKGYGTWERPNGVHNSGALYASRPSEDNGTDDYTEQLIGNGYPPFSLVRRPKRPLNHVNGATKENEAMLVLCRSSRQANAFAPSIEKELAAANAHGYQQSFVSDIFHYPWCQIQDSRSMLGSSSSWSGSASPSSSFATDVEFSTVIYSQKRSPSPEYTPSPSPKDVRNSTAVGLSRDLLEKWSKQLEVIGDYPSRGCLSGEDRAASVNADEGSPDRLPTDSYIDILSVPVDGSCDSRRSELSGSSYIASDTKDSNTLHVASDVDGTGAFVGLAFGGEIVRVDGQTNVELSSCKENCVGNVRAELHECSDVEIKKTVREPVIDDRQNTMLPRHTIDPKKCHSLKSSRCIRLRHVHLTGRNGATISNVALWTRAEARGAEMQILPATEPNQDLDNTVDNEIDVLRQAKLNQPPRNKSCLERKASPDTTNGQIEEPGFKRRCTSQGVEAVKIKTQRGDLNQQKTFPTQKQTYKALRDAHIRFLRSASRAKATDTSCQRFCPPCSDNGIHLAFQSSSQPERQMEALHRKSQASTTRHSVDSWHTSRDLVETEASPHTHPAFANAGRHDDIKFLIDGIRLRRPNGAAERAQAAKHKKWATSGGYVKKGVGNRRPGGSLTAGVVVHDAAVLD